MAEFVMSYLKFLVKETADLVLIKYRHYIKQTWHISWLPVAFSEENTRKISGIKQISRIPSMVEEHGQLKA